MSGSLYIHVPFCRAKCSYCDFYSIPLKSGLVDGFVRSLRKEIQQRARGRLSTIYIGGGTPSVLPPGSIRDILNSLGEHAFIDEGAEISVEANPESLSQEFIDEVHGAGVSRLSVGVQSLDDGLLRVLRRPHTSSGAMEALERIKGSGLDLSLDLMYSIPGQTPGGWASTLQAAIGIRPSHISAYELTLEPGTPLEKQVTEGILRAPGEEDSMTMYETAVSALGDAGYEHYEVSNYALSSKRSRHNMNYWRRGEYLGLGPGAVSFREGIRTRNLPDVSVYCDAIDQGELPVFEEEMLTRDEASREFLMLGLRTSEGVDIAEASVRYGLDSLPGATARFVESGMMASKGGRLFFTHKGMPLMNSVLLKLFESLGI